MEHGDTHTERKKTRKKKRRNNHRFDLFSLALCVGLDVVDITFHSTTYCLDGILFYFYFLFVFHSILFLFFVFFQVSFLFDSLLICTHPWSSLFLSIHLKSVPSNHHFLFWPSKEKTRNQNNNNKPTVKKSNKKPTRFPLSSGWLISTEMQICLTNKLDSNDWLINWIRK